MSAHIGDAGVKRVHFIGIGGCSMSGLAAICKSQGYEITGSDKTQSPFTRRLEDKGVPVTIGHDPKNVRGADLAVYSAAIKEDNPERREAQRLGIPQLERSALLGQLSRGYGQVVGVAGCHGKTTMTSMLALMLIKAELDPTVHVGGIVPFLDGGVREGGHRLFVTEACEYVDSYLELRPTIAIVNNIDDDHLDYFKDMDAIVHSFRAFIGLLPPGGTVIINAGDERAARLAPFPEGRRVVTYGENGQYQAKNVRVDQGLTHFDVYFQGQKLFDARLNVPGLHNVTNALGATAAALLLGADLESVARALEEYTLTQRRFELMGRREGVYIYHDYAHHPSEIRACLQGAKSVCQGRLIALFQCNSYTRAKTLFTHNVSCFDDADLVLVPDIYPGRETDTGLVHAKDMVAAIAKSGVECLYLPTFEEIRAYLDGYCMPGDMVVTLGSGDVYFQTKKLL